MTPGVMGDPRDSGPLQEGTQMTAAILLLILNLSSVSRVLWTPGLGTEAHDTSSIEGGENELGSAWDPNGGEHPGNEFGSHWDPNG